jgi:hypothetical protein
MATKKELLEQARSLGLNPVTRNSVAELEAMIATATAKPKASRSAKARRRSAIVVCAERPDRQISKGLERAPIGQG